MIHSPFRIKFQSTLPVGEATPKAEEVKEPPKISIHASRGGSDSIEPEFSQYRSIFQSTLPVGEATYKPPFDMLILDISIHASRGGSDCAVNPSPIYRIWHHGFREPGFSGFFHRRFPCFFPLGTGGSHLPNVRHIEASHFFYYTISNGCPSSISTLVHFKSPLKAQKLPEIPQVTGPCTGRPGF